MSRAAYTVAMHRESSELERSLIDQRVDEAYEKVYEYLEPAAARLRSLLCAEGRRALEEMERAYQQAIELAARSGIGVQAVGKTALPQADRVQIPTAPLVPQVAADPTPFADPDRVLHIRPCS